MGGVQRFQPWLYDRHNDRRSFPLSHLTPSTRRACRDVCRSWHSQYHCVSRYIPERKPTVLEPVTPPHLIIVASVTNIFDLARLAHTVLTADLQTGTYRLRRLLCQACRIDRTAQRRGGHGAECTTRWSLSRPFPAPNDAPDGLADPLGKGVGGSSAGAVAVVGRSGLRSLGFPRAVVFGCRDRSVSSARPSNRACRSPAHGSPTSFTGGVRPREPARTG